VPLAIEQKADHRSDNRRAWRQRYDGNPDSYEGDTMSSAHPLADPIRALLFACAACLAACAQQPMGPSAINAVQAQSIVDNPVRTDQDRRMDASRHPVEFLTFTQVASGMRVMDMASGGGYTSQLLALAVAPNGTLYAQVQQPGATLTKRLADHPQTDVVLVVRKFDDPIPEGLAPLDLVTLVLNYHDISYLPVDRAKMNQRVFAALKPGGHFVVVDHSAKAGTGISAGKTLHRIDQAVVLEEVKQAGFVLEAEGDFLRNPADTREESSNEPKVPTDKFALRFVKPK
jgi:predicted methyltransferase